MMKRNTIVMAALAASMSLAALGARADDATYTKDIAPIMMKNCVVCHRPGEAVPMTLATYKDIRPWVKSIKKAVQERAMPPWHADPAVGQWKDERRLTDEEIQKIVSWANAGAPLGDILDMPPAPKFEKGWKIGEPDAVFHFTKDVELPAALTDDYMYVTMKTNFKEDRWLKAVECRAGNLEVVHHIIAFSKAKTAGGAAGIEKGGFGGASLLGGMAPGSDPFIMPEGMGILLPAGGDIIFQMHYHKESGAAAKDNSMIGVKFADYPVQKQYHADAAFNVLFAIPPNAANHEVNAIFSAPADIELRTIMPHMHLRGKSMKVWAKFPDGREQDLLWVPRYDFNWQTIYQLKEPLPMPKGTKLYARAVYDNSANNPFNPDPNQTVRFGEPTTDEMMFAFLSYTNAGEKLNAYDPGAKKKPGY